MLPLHATLSSPGGAPTLAATLASLNHLNLAYRLVRDSAHMETHGGYCDIYIGRLDAGTPQEKKVAIKRIRIHTRKDEDFAKVCHLRLEHWILLRSSLVDLLYRDYRKNCLYGHA